MEFYYSTKLRELRVLRGEYGLYCGYSVRPGKLKKQAAFACFVVYFLLL